MLETRDELAAQQICGHKIFALEDEIQAEVSHLDATLVRIKASAAALHSYLYDRTEPVRDAAMLALTVAVKVLIALAVIVCATSIVSHVVTFHFFGVPGAVSLLLGLTVTGLAAASGHLFYENILAKNKALEAGIICVASALFAWGLLDLAQARSIMVAKASEASATNTAASSFVEDAPGDPSPPESAEQNQSEKLAAREKLSSGILKIMLAADALLGILLGVVFVKKQEENYVSWHELRGLLKEKVDTERRRNELLSMVEIAKKRCMAGILRAKHTNQRRFPPYHQLPIIVLMLAATALPVFAQSIDRHEGILLDVSWSIGAGGANSDLFREYLFSIKRLLATEPPKSRVWVSVISTDSFGSVRELVKGWTPEGQGVFTDDLDRARRQLASTFESRAAGLSPVASGTDIIGGLCNAPRATTSSRRSMAIAFTSLVHPSRA
jgi:hypothetical protein